MRVRSLPSSLGGPGLPAPRGQALGRLISAGGGDTPSFQGQAQVFPWTFLGEVRSYPYPEVSCRQARS